MIIIMKKIIGFLIMIFAVNIGLACDGIYVTKYAHEIASIYMDFKNNCCAGSEITIVDLNSGDSQTFTQGSHGPNSSCSNDAYIV